MASVFCTKCGSQLSEGSKFCTTCGAPAPAMQSDLAANVNVPIVEDIVSTQVVPVQAPAEPIIEPDPNNPYTPSVPDYNFDASAVSSAPIQIDIKPEPEPVLNWQPAPTPVPQPMPAQTYNTTPVQRPVPLQPAPQPAQRQQPPYQPPMQPQQRPPVPPIPQQNNNMDRPSPSGAYALMSVWDTVGSIILMGLPVIGLIISIIWAVGGCRKINRRNLARAFLLLMAIGLVLSIIFTVIFGVLYADVITDVFESVFPGYSIEWGF